ncbi:MAG: hypothetical protein IPJ19_21370 [Planctomycetes bacterium]|nr:hypothetical protein [Planctomycetota bacterium]
MPLRGDSTLDCKEARELTRGFLSGGGALDRRAEWRAHLAACRECDEHYRDTVEMLSRLHRARKGGPEIPSAPGAPARPAQAQTEEPPARRSLIAFSPPPTRVRWKPRKRGGWLALALPFVALAVFGAIGLPGNEVREANALALYGAVEVDQHMIAPGDAARALVRGSQIVVAEKARVRVQDEHSELVLEGEGALQCESFRPLRVRLFGGHLEGHGACTVSTAVGLVECPSGVLEMGIDAEGLYVRPLASGASFRDAAGLRALAPGEEFRARLSLDPATQH